MANSLSGAVMIAPETADASEAVTTDDSVAASSSASTAACAGSAASSSSVAWSGSSASSGSASWDSAVWSSGASGSAATTSGIAFCGGPLIAFAGDPVIMFDAMGGPDVSSAETGAADDDAVCDPRIVDLLDLDDVPPDEIMYMTGGAIGSPAVAGGDVQRTLTPLVAVSNTPTTESASTATAFPIALAPDLGSTKPVAQPAIAQTGTAALSTATPPATVAPNAPAVTATVDLAAPPEAGDATAPDPLALPGELPS